MFSDVLSAMTTSKGLEQLINGLPSWGLVLLIALAIYVLTKSAEKMVDGAVALARRTGMPVYPIGVAVRSITPTRVPRREPLRIFLESSKFCQLNSSIRR